MGTFIGSLTYAATITLTDPIITHPLYICTMPLTHTDISSSAVTNMAHSKLFSISPILTLYTNISSAVTLMHSFSPKLKSNHWTQMTTSFSVII